MTCRSQEVEPKASNGPTEALNDLIKRIKRIGFGFGFRNFENYRIRPCSTQAGPPGARWARSSSDEVLGPARIRRAHLERKTGFEPATPTLARWRFWSWRSASVRRSGIPSTQFPARPPHPPL
jgi:hypothetical protein